MSTPPKKSNPKFDYVAPKPLFLLHRQQSRIPYDLNVEAIVWWVPCIGGVDFQLRMRFRCVKVVEESTRGGVAISGIKRSGKPAMRLTHRGARGRATAARRSSTLIAAMVGGSTGEGLASLQLDIAMADAAPGGGRTIGNIKDNKAWWSSNSRAATRGDGKGDAGQDATQVVLRLKGDAYANDSRAGRLQQQRTRRSCWLLLIGLDILAFDRVQICGRARARRRHLAIYSKDIEAALLRTFLGATTVGICECPRKCCQCSIDKAKVFVMLEKSDSDELMIIYFSARSRQGKGNCLHSSLVVSHGLLGGPWLRPSTLGVNRSSVESYRLRVDQTMGSWVLPWHGAQGMLKASDKKIKMRIEEPNKDLKRLDSGDHTSQGGDITRDKRRNRGGSCITSAISESNAGHDLIEGTKLPRLTQTSTTTSVLDLSHMSLRARPRTSRNSGRCDGTSRGQINGHVFAYREALEEIE
ncbi:hypothetical protein Syun_012197 [Stephania yunnanensis]|uniref:Uncharacterized protein n=1 Tax=Stephania yunnanensis TaxID=152371 RepID=A0AAP0JZ49_9MAGN